MKSIIVPQLNLRGKQFQIVVPSSKSIANRALILAALRKGTTMLRGDFAAEDIQIMIGALSQLDIRVVKGIKGIKITNDLKWRIDTHDLELFLGNSGTSIRFLTSLVCFRNGTTVLTGKPRMLERPIGDLVDALRHMGAHIEYLKKDGFPPLKIIGHGQLQGGNVAIKANISSQFLSSLMLVAPFCEKMPVFRITGQTISKPYIAMTKRIIRQFKTVRDYEVEGDASAAVYWWALGFLHGCNVNISNIPKNSLQGDLNFLEVLRTLKTVKTLTTHTLDLNDMPDASLMLMGIAPLLKFPIKIINIGSLRVKETDRITAMATELGRIGVRVKTGRDWIKIWPLQGFKTTPIRINTYDDHRIAMSMAILGTKLGNLEIMDPDCVNKTYPGFWEQLRRFKNP